ncbi:Gfo/Idh/MocA family protein, partial [candidate division KSB1 bacterium]
LGVGFIGAGFNGNFHARAWVGVRDADIRAICDPNLERANSLADTCRQLKIGDPKVYADAGDMVADPAVDAVWLNAPNYTRIPIMESISRTIQDGKGKLTGIACEKPLGRNFKEAQQMYDMIKELEIPHGYLENQVFAPSLVRGREISWGRGASVTGRPYLARCAEEHSGPHEPWFWTGSQQGGGALNDMLCHSVEAARYLLTKPGDSKNTLKPKTISAEIGSLKWSRPEYIKILKEMSNGEVDYSKAPAEDFAKATIVFETPEGHPAVIEVTSSWSFVGPGLRLSFEMLGPEYYMQVNTLAPELYVFLSRAVSGAEGEDMVEKQNAEGGLMPVMPNEELSYGYTDEDRHMVQSFLEGKMPNETWEDGLIVAQLLAHCYYSSEQGKKVAFEPGNLESFIPAVAKGTWKPSSIFQAGK